MGKNLEWDFIKPLKSVALIDEFEEKVGFKFPQSFRDCVIANNGGYPNKIAFDTDKTKERVFDSLLSFNREDRCTVWDFYDAAAREDFEELGKAYIEFASSGFGDPIAFDPETGYIIFVNHETLEIELIAKTFEEFLDKLYDDEEEEADEVPIEEVKEEPKEAPKAEVKEEKPPKKRGFKFPFFGKR